MINYININYDKLYKIFINNKKLNKSKSKLIQ